jgi:hypothetical protein
LGAIGDGRHSTFFEATADGRLTRRDSASALSLRSL